MYESIEANRWDSFLLLLAFVLLVAAIGWAFGEWTGYGYGGLAIAAIAAVVMAWSSYYYSDQIVLTMSGARPADREEQPYLVNTVEGVAIAAGLPAPRPYLIDDTAPNAFATGRDPQHAAIAVTTGLLQKLNRQELEGVIGHEMSHIANRDILFMTLAAVLVGTVALLADWMWRISFWGGRRRSRDGGGGGYLGLVAIVLMLLAPLAASLLRLALSRRREYLADANGALLTRYPEGLASALEKIAADSEPLEVANKATAHLWIANPLKEHGGWLNTLFDTHPPIEDRIRRLREMAGMSAVE